MAIYFFDKNQTLIKIVPESATFEAIQTQELDDDSLLKDTLSVTVKGDENLLNAEYVAVKSYAGNAQTFDMYRIVTDTTPDKTMSFTGMSLAPYELNGHIIQDLRPANHSLSYTLNRVLDGTDWRVGYIDDGLSNVTTTFYYVSAKEALKELQSLVGCEFVFKVEISGQKITDKWIEVYSEMGNRTKKRFNYGTNALTVVRETNKADIYTALIGRGKGEEVSSAEDNASGQAGYGRKITFEDIEWKKSSGKPLDKPKGQYYLELPQATQAYGIKNIDGTMKARVGIVDFDDEEDKNRLINLTYQQLLVSSRPKVLFKTTVANVGATGIGDTVTIHRHDLNIHYQTRVRKIVRNKLNDNKTQIELGDAVVTASTKQAKQNNATIKNLNNEIDKIKANVTTSQNSADGKNTIFYGSAQPERQRTGDTWYRPHPSIAGETQMLTWNGTAWELVIDTSDLTSVSRAVEDATNKADEAVQSAKDADTKANDALVKAGANANLLTTHQNTIDTINTVTLPDILSTAGTALANAKSAKEDFQVFKTSYETNDKLIKARLLAVDSDKEGSIAYRLNETEKTASGNTTTIANIKKSPEENITGYQTIKERSDLYERVIGKDENGVKGNISRIVQTSGIIQSEVASSVPNPNLLSGTDFKEGLGDVIAYGREPTLSEASFFPYGKVATINTPETSGTANVGFAVKIPKKDTWYTLSFYGLANWLGTAGVDFYVTDPYKTLKNYKATLLTEYDLATYRIQVTVKATVANAIIYVRPQGNRFNGKYNNIVFWGVKLEGGEVATKWGDNVSSSKITQLENTINLKVSNKDLLSQINVQAGGVLITSGTNKLNVTPETTYIEDSTIKSAMIESLEADKIKTGTLDAGKVKVINIDAENITSNVTDFIKSNWNEATGGGVTITGAGVRAINSEGSRVTLENGVVSVGNRAGVNLGFFGDHVLNKSATGTMTITASHGTETAFISATSTDGKTYKRSMSIMAGASEIDMFTTLDMNKNALKDVTNIGFTGGLIKGNIRGSARYMTIDAGTGTSFDVSGVTRMSVTSVVNIFSGIDMKGKDIASVGKLTYNSDQRLKTNIKDTNIRALDAIRNWQLVSYDWLEGGEHVEIGLIAQNSPEVMTYNEENDIYGIDAGKQTMINTLAIQQLDSKTNDEITQLKKQIASLQDELALLKGD